MAQPGSSDGVYLLHGVIRDDVRAPLPDIDGVELSWVDSGAGLKGLVSSTEAMRDHTAQGLVASGEAAMDLAMAHHRLLAGLAPFIDLAPVALSAGWPSIDAIKANIGEHKAAFETALNRTAGHVEYVVKVLSADRENAPEKPTPEKPAPEKPTPASEAKPGGSGRDYLMARKAKRDAKRSQVDRIEMYCEAVEAGFAPHAALLERTPLKDHSAGSKRIWLQFSALVARGAGEKTFVDAGAPIYEQGQAIGLELEVSGPWPVYTFCKPPDSGIADG